MPYKDPKSPEAKASQKRRTTKYRTKNRKRYLMLSKKNYVKNRKKMIKKQQKYIQKIGRKEYLFRRRRNHLKNLYGLSWESYQVLLKSQNKVCAICLSKNKSKRKLAVDHSHDNGNIRGLLCDKCNRGLGYFNDDISILKKVIKYLKKHG